MQDTEVETTLHGRKVEPLAGRFRVYPRIIVTAYVVSFVLALSLNLLGAAEIRFFADFVTFYSAAGFAEIGDLAAAFDEDRLAEAQVAATGWEGSRTPWFYPPSYMFFIFWLPWLPYYLSGLLFTFLTLALFLYAVRPLLLDRDDLWIVCGAPVVALNAAHGQNAFLTAGLAVLAFRWLEHREVRAGLALGLLTFKPHLGILWPIVLLIKERWTTIAVATLTAVAMVALSLALYGPEAWRAFFQEGLLGAGDHLSKNSLPASLTASPFAGLTLLGVPPQTAMICQIAVTATLAGALVYLFLTSTPYRFVMAFLFAACLYATPHNFTYDWMFVLVAALVVWREARLTGFLKYEKAGLVLSYVTPMLLQPLRDVNLPVAALLVLVPIAVTWRRARHEAQRRTPAGG